MLESMGFVEVVLSHDIERLSTTSDPLDASSF